MDFRDFYTKFDDNYHGKVHLILADPPFNVLRQQRDTIDQSSMEILIKMSESFLVKGGTLIIFCSIDQFSIYKECLNKSILSVEPLALNIINSEKCILFLIF